MKTQELLLAAAKQMIEELTESTMMDDKHRRACLVSRAVCKHETFRKLASAVILAEAENR